MKLLISDNLEKKLPMLDSESRKQFYTFVQQATAIYDYDIFRHARRLSDDVYVAPLGSHRLFFTQQVNPQGQKVVILLDFIHRGDPEYLNKMVKHRHGRSDKF